MMMMIFVCGVRTPQTIQTSRYRSRHTPNPPNRTSFGMDILVYVVFMRCCVLHPPIFNLPHTHSPPRIIATTQCNATQTHSLPTTSTQLTHSLSRRRRQQFTPTINNKTNPKHHVQKKKIRAVGWLVGWLRKKNNKNQPGVCCCTGVLSSYVYNHMWNNIYFDCWPQLSSKHLHHLSLSLSLSLCTTTTTTPQSVRNTNTLTLSHVRAKERLVVVALFLFCAYCH